MNHSVNNNNNMNNQVAGPGGQAAGNQAALVAILQQQQQQQQQNQQPAVGGHPQQQPQRLPSLQSQVLIGPPSHPFSPAVNPNSNNNFSLAPPSSPPQAFASGNAPSLLAIPPTSSSSVAQAPLTPVSNSFRSNTYQETAGPPSSASVSSQQTLSSSLPQQGQEDLEQLPELRNRIRLHIEEAIKLISQEDKAAYLEAKEKAPDLVRNESDVLEFIRYCKYDAWSAANRLCLYWKERKKLFGNRAFLPLVLTGTGALTKEDLLTLQAGFPAFLPDSSKGQKVMLVDRRKWIPSATSENRIRCMWFMFNLLSKNDRAQTEQDYVLVLALHIAPRVYDADETFLDKISFLVSKVFPVLHQLNIGVIPSPRQPYAIQTLMAKGMKFYQAQSTSPTPNVMIQREPGQLFQELQENLNLTAEGIPMDIGGHWSIDAWFRWCQERQEKEREKYQWLIWEAPNHADVQQQCGRQTRTAEEKLERRRLADLLHSRRKRERQKQELSSLQSQSASLKTRNAELKAEHSRLEGLLHEAEAVIKRLKPGD